ncbi:MAG: hypothetical protein BGO09_15420 [Bacteroidetes bacterium 47-18]|nr:MAG: hypothetical protein BGO09_15420 [Bacteroidetes bacterium 47-18]
MIRKVLLLAGLAIAGATGAFAQKYKVMMSTTQGNIEMILYDETPLHSENFVKLAREGFYDSLLFHRVIPEFMVQGGDPTSKNAAPGTPLGSGSHGNRIPAEFKTDKYIHKRGALAAARDNNPEKASSGCQFYIVAGKTVTDAELDMIQQRIGIKYTDAQKNIYKTQGGTPFLDNNYTVYGEVVKGMETVDKIVSQKRNGMDRPDVDQRILSVKVLVKDKNGKYTEMKQEKGKK